MLDRLIVQNLCSPSLLATKAYYFSSRRARLTGNYIAFLVNLSTRRYSCSYTYISCVIGWERNFSQQLRVTLWFINCSASWNVILISTVLGFMNTTEILRHQLIISRLNRKRFGHAIRHLMDARSKPEPKMRPSILSGIVTRDAPVSYWPIISLSFQTIPDVFAIVNSRF